MNGPLELPNSRDVAFITLSILHNKYFIQMTLFNLPLYMYFLVQLFAVHAEGFPGQVNYLVGEADNCGKGDNVVISLLQHFLQKYRARRKQSRSGPAVLQACSRGVRGACSPWKILKKKSAMRTFFLRFD